MATFFKIRKYILFGSQLSGSIICIYFIIQVQNYEVSWSLLTHFMPNVASKLNNFLGMVGTYILLIPLTIIIVSFFIPESISLRIAASSFGVGGTLFVIMSGLFHDTLTQTYNMRFVVISKILSLEEKRAIFRAEFIRMMELQYQKSLEVYKMLKEHILEKLNIYDEKLITIPDALTIKIYAKETVNNLILIYTKHENTLAITEQNYLLKYVGYALVTLVVVLLCGAVIRLYVDNSELKKAATLVLDGAVISEQGAQQAVRNVSHQIDLVNNTKQLAETTAIRVGNLVADSVQVAFEKTDFRITAIEVQQQKLITILQNLYTKIYDKAAEIT